MRELLTVLVMLAVICVGIWFNMWLINKQPVITSNKAEVRQMLKDCQRIRIDEDDGVFTVWCEIGEDYE